MARTVKVALQAEVGQYKRGMGEAERATAKLSDAIDDIDGTPFDTAAGRAKGLGDAADDAADRATRDFDEIARHAAELDRRIRDTETGMRSLAKGFASTGDPKILAAWKEQGRVLGDLKNIRKYLPDPAEAARAGVGLGQRLGDGLTKSVPPQLTTALIAGGVAAAPFLAGTLVGAVSGAAGGIGIAGGVVLALKDPRIKAEVKRLGGDIGDQLRGSAGPFGPEMLRAISVVRAQVRDLRDETDRIFANSSRSLVPLTGSVATALGDIVQGIDRVVAKAGPTLAVIGAGVEGIGEQVEIFLNMVAENSDIGAQALGDLFTIVEYGISYLTTMVNILAKVYQFSTAWAAPFRDGAKESEKYAAGAAKAGDSAGFLGREVDKSGQAAQRAEHKYVSLTETLEGIVNKNLSAAEATLRLREATSAAADAVDKKRRVSQQEEGALLALARAANTATKTLDDQGRTVGAATRAHEANRKKLYETAVAMGYTKAEAKKLADQYLVTPKNVTTRVSAPGTAQSDREIREYDKKLDNLARQIRTDVRVSGVSNAAYQLERLLIQQQALKKGISVSAAASAFRKNAYAEGGWTGPGPKHQEAGVVHADEYVLQKSARRRIEQQHPGLLNEMNATGQIPGYAGGGRVLSAPFPVNASITKIMTLAEALSKVTPSFGAWPSSPSAQRGDSGVWRRVLQVIRAGPQSGAFGNAYRPGDPLWHGSGRAVDWMGAGQDRLAGFLAAKRPLELIHRTAKRDYAYTRGRNVGSFGEALMNAHRNHIHIAMAGGGVIREPVMGVGRSGATYSFAERGPERVLSNAQTVAGGGVTNYITIAPQLTPSMNPREVGRQIAEALTPYLAAGGEIRVRGQKIF